MELTGLEASDLHVKVLEADSLEPRDLERRNGVISCIVATGGSKVEGQEVSKGVRTDSVGSPFVVNEEGFVYQSFPMSEEEMIIINLEEKMLAGESPASSSSSCTSLLPSMSSVPALPLATQGLNVAVVVHEDKCHIDSDVEDSAGVTKLQRSTTVRKRHSGKQTKTTSDPQSQIHAPSFGDCKGSKGTEVIPCDWLQCILCRKVLPSKGTLQHHFATAHSDVPLTLHPCSVCLEEFWSEDQLAWHLRHQHGIRIATAACVVCGVQLATPAECQAHMRKHPATLPCPVCTQKFSSQQQVSQHLEQHHLPHLLPNICPVCGKRFSHPAALQTHMWRHSTQACPQPGCKHQAEDESWILVHLKNHHSHNSCDRHHYNNQHHDHSLTLQRDIDDRLLDHLFSCYFSPNTPQVQMLPSPEGLRTETQQPGLPASPQKGNQNEEEVEGVVQGLIEAVVRVEREGEMAHPQHLVSWTKNGAGLVLHRCGLCNAYLPSVPALISHKAHHTQVMKCLQCDKLFHSLKQLKLHMTIHDGDLPPGKPRHKDDIWQCLQCGHTCGSDSALSRHRNTHNQTPGQGRHQCTVCQRKMSTRSHLTEHMSRVHKIYDESKCLQCSVCDRRFSSKTPFLLHQWTHPNSGNIGKGDDGGDWRCSECRKSFSRQGALQRHMATHRHSKFVCGVCGNNFGSAVHLAAHSRTHDSGHKAKLPCPHCLQKFAYKSHLKVHLRTHTGEKPYVCEICGKGFKRLQQCKVHHRMTHSKQREACVECDQTFGDKTNLLRHRLLVHHHLKRWVCGVCAQSYAYSQDLRKHLYKKHNLTFQPLDASTKKSRHEVYVVPEEGMVGMSKEAKEAVKRVSEAERYKVEQVLASTHNSLLRGTTTTTSTIGATISTTVSNSTNATNILLLPRADSENTGLCVDFGVRMPEGLVNCRVCDGGDCDSDGGEQGEPVLFQCSVCGVSSGSQAQCVAHVMSTHSSHSQESHGATPSLMALSTAPPPPPPPPPPLFLAPQPPSQCLIQLPLVPQQPPPLPSQSTHSLAPMQPPEKEDPRILVQSSSTGAAPAMSLMPVPPSLGEGQALCTLTFTAHGEDVVMSPLQPQLPPNTTTTTIMDKTVLSDNTSLLVLTSASSTTTVPPCPSPPLNMEEQKQQTEKEEISGAHGHENGAATLMKEVRVEIMHQRTPPKKSLNNRTILPPKKATTGRDQEISVQGLSTLNMAFECEMCSKSFKSSAHLRKHRRTHEGQRHACGACPKSFTEKYNLKIHMLTHTRERPHVCPLCLRAFRYARDLAEHRRSHEGTKPHRCTECNRSFVRQRDYARHFREQHSAERHQCRVCGASFKRRFYLETVHMRTHYPQTQQKTEEEGHHTIREEAKQNQPKSELEAQKQPQPQPGSSNLETKEEESGHICRICGRTFTHARYLTSHLHTHSRRATYVRCPKCPRMFVSQSTLKVHQDTFHKQDRGQPQS